MDIGQHAVCHRSRHQVGVHTIVAAPSGRDAGTVPAVTRGATLPPVHYRIIRKFTSANRMTVKVEAAATPGEWESIGSAIETRTAPYSLAPPTHVPQLDMVAQALSGKWNLEREDYSSEISHAGSQDEINTVKCWRDGDVLKCITYSAGLLLFESVYNYDKSSGKYRVMYIFPSSVPKVGNLAINGATWLYTGTIKGAQGETLQFRMTAVFKRPELQEGRAEYSSNGVDWITFYKFKAMRGGSKS